MKKFLKRLLAYGAVVVLALSIGNVDASQFTVTGPHPVTSLNSATESELVTVGSTVTELDAESTLTFDGSTLVLTGAQTTSGDAIIGGSGTPLLNGLTVEDGAPHYYIRETGATTDEGLWDIFVDSDNFFIRVVNDANSVVSNIMAVARTTTTIDNVDFPHGRFSFGGDSVVNSLMRLTPGEVTRDIATSVGIGLDIIADAWDVNASGSGETVAIGANVFIGIPTWTSTATTFTISDAATLYVQGIPVTTTDSDITATRSYAALFDAGNVRIDDKLLVGTNNIVGSNAGEIVLANAGQVRFITTGSTAANYGVGSNSANDLDLDVPDTGDEIRFMFADSHYASIANTGAGPYLQFRSEAGDPGDAANNHMLLYTVENSGTELRVRMNRNLEQVLASEEMNRSIGGTSEIGTMLNIEPGIIQRDLLTTIGMGIYIEADAWDVNAAGSGETVAIGSLVYYGIPTWTSTATTFTVSDATTLYVEGIPVTTTDSDITATRSYVAWFDAGDVRVDGAITGVPAAALVMHSQDDVIFNIDSDNSGTDAVYIWGRNRVNVTGGAELMRLDEAGLLTLLDGVTVGSNIISDTDSTDDLGTTSVRWANLFVDSIGDTGQAMTFPGAVNTTGLVQFTIGMLVNTSGGAGDFNVQSNDQGNMLFSDGLTNAVQIGGPVLVGTGFIVYSGSDSTRDMVTSVGLGFHMPADTTGINAAGDGATIANASMVHFGRPVWTSVATTLTLTDSATLYIENSPDVTDANVTATRSYAGWFDAGDVRIDANLYFSEDHDNLIGVNAGHFISGSEASHTIFVDTDNDDAGRFIYFRKDGLTQTGGTGLGLFSESGQFRIGNSTTDFTGTIFAIEPGSQARDMITSIGTGFHMEVDAQAVNAAGNSETVAIGSAAFLGIQTWTSVGLTMTISDMTTLYVQGPPVDSDNITATRTTAAWFDAGDVRIDGVITGNAGTIGITIGSGGLVGINETVNANMAIGLTIQQSTNDNQSLALKSSTDVVTGMSTLPLSTGFDVETDDFLVIGKSDGATGGAYFISIAESGGATNFFESWAGAPATTDTDASLGQMNFFVGEHNASNADVDMLADSNAIAWGEINSSGARLTRMLLKADDGELHLGNTTIADLAADHYSDAELLRLYVLDRSEGSPGIIRTRWDQNLHHVKQDLVDLRVISSLGDDSLLCVQCMMSLQNGAIWQNHVANKELEREIRFYRVRMVNLEKRLNDYETRFVSYLLAIGN